jgi:hypothetical protein
MGTFTDITGKRFGRLVALRCLGTSSTKQLVWEFQCDCGNRCSTKSLRVKSGHTRSCGCLHKEIARQLLITHGKSRTIEFSIWGAMQTRCYNEKSIGYKHYGGRGINICSRWGKFENFLADMGERPGRSYSLDRINNDKGYSKANCRWATKDQQANNCRSNIRIKYKELKLTLSQWAKKLNINFGSLYYRVVTAKWPPKKALTTLIRK